MDLWPSDEDRFVLSCPTVYCLVYEPPAGNFLYEQKVTKNSLRTYGSKNSLVLTYLRF